MAFTCVQMVLAVALTTLIWVVTVLLTPPVEPQRLTAFHERIRPLITPFGWALVATVLGWLTVYAALATTGWWTAAHSSRPRGPSVRWY